MVNTADPFTTRDNFLGANGPSRNVRETKNLLIFEKLGKDEMFIRD